MDLPNAAQSFMNAQMHEEVKETAEIHVFLTKVFGWMGLGVFTSFATSILFAFTPLAYLILNPLVFYGIFAVEFILVVWLAKSSIKMSTAKAAVLFLLYSFASGITLSVIFYIYTSYSILTTFFVAVTMFGAMAAYGHFTKQDLSKIGSIAIMGVIGLIIGSIINIFVASTMIDWIITYAGVAIFLVLTAWDAQKIKLYAQNYGTGSNIAIRAALTLYLDFINLFLYLLRILGSRRR